MLKFYEYILLASSLGHFPLNKEISLEILNWKYHSGNIVPFFSFTHSLWKNVF